MTTSGLRIDASDFQRAFKDYMKVTSRTGSEAINQKAYEVNIAATSLTVKKKAAELTAELMEVAQGKNGRSAPRAALIVNAMRGKQGMKGLRGPEMQAEMDAFIKQRRSHVAFLASGFLPAVAIFAQAIGKAAGKSAVRRLEKFGQAIGRAIPAVAGFNPTATFWNEAGARATHNAEGAELMAGQGLQSAIIQTTSRIDDYVAKRMQEASDKFIGRILR